MDLAGWRGKDFAAECLIPTLTSAAAAEAAAVAVAAAAAAVVVAAAAAADLGGQNHYEKVKRDLTEEQEMERGV